MRRGIKLALAAVAVAFALPAAASAQDHVVRVNVPEFTWNPDFIEAEPGETVQWQFKRPNGDPVILQHDVVIHDGPNTSYPVLADSGYHVPSDPESPQELDYTFEEEGRYTYICTIHQPDMTGTVEVGDDPPPEGDPKLYLGLKRKRARGKFRKVTSFPAIIRNTGDALMQDAMVCARAPRRLVKVTDGRCASYASLGEGETRRPKFTFKPKKRARGKKVRIKFIASATGLPNKTKIATLKVRR